MTHYESVVEFMVMMGQPIITTPTEPTTKLGLLRINLIKEEIGELSEAFNDDDYIEIADALADILYVTYGAHGSFGIEPAKFVDYHPSISAIKPARLPTMAEAHTAHQTLVKLLSELVRALQTSNMSLVSKSLDDIIKEAYRIAAMCGIDIFSCFSEVHDSNMSKACLTQSDAEASLKYRREDPITAGKYRDAEVFQVGERFILRRAGDGKVLKGIHYFEPNLQQFLKL